MSIYVALGSNLGDRLANLNRALHLLDQRGITPLARSSIYESRPVGMDSEHDFYNAVVRVDCRKSPEALLETLHEVEDEMGRSRDGGTPANRTCDLDLLYYGDVRRCGNDLDLPHPRIHHRRFVLLPLLELYPGKRDPLTGELLVTKSVQLADDPLQRCERRLGPEDWGQLQGAAPGAGSEQLFEGDSATHQQYQH